jgi:hypothetical protein
MRQHISKLSYLNLYQLIEAYYTKITVHWVDDNAFINVPQWE